MFWNFQKFKKHAFRSSAICHPISYLWNESKYFMLRSPVFLTLWEKVLNIFKCILRGADVTGNVLFLVGTERKESPEVRLCHHGAGKTDRWFSDSTIHKDVGVSRPPLQVRETFLEIGSLQRYSSKWSLHWKQMNMIRKYPWKKKTI